MKNKYRKSNEKTTNYKIVPRSCSHYNRPRVTLGEGSLGESKVSVGAYIDSLELIGQLLDAGENLQALRIAESGRAYDYDVYDETVSDDRIVTTISRRMDFDLVDWSKLKSDIDAKLALQKESDPPVDVSSYTS